MHAGGSLRQHFWHHSRPSLPSTCRAALLCTQTGLQLTSRPATPGALGAVADWARLMAGTLEPV